MEKKSSLEQQQHGHVKKSAVWDSGSNLYDSYELKSFQLQLGSAISPRTMSMPRLPTREHRASVAAVVAAAPTITDASAKPSKVKTSSKISRSVQKMVKAVLRIRLPRMAAGGRVDAPITHYAATNPWFTTGGLTTIPEACEKGFEWPPKPVEDGPEVRKAASERFTGRVSVFG